MYIARYLRKRNNSRGTFILNSRSDFESTDHSLEEARRRPTPYIFEECLFEIEEILERFERSKDKKLVILRAGEEGEDDVYSLTGLFEIEEMLHGPSEICLWGKVPRSPLLRDWRIFIANKN